MGSAKQYISIKNTSEDVNTTEQKAWTNTRRSLGFPKRTLPVDSLSALLFFWSVVKKNAIVPGILLYAVKSQPAITRSREEKQSWQLNKKNYEGTVRPCV